jgi:hypothetical protein
MMGNLSKRAVKSVVQLRVHDKGQESWNMSVEIKRILSIKVSEIIWKIISIGFQDFIVLSDY